MPLKNLNTSLLKSAFIYTIINFVNKSFPFFLLPLFTRIFSLEEYGFFSLYKAAMNILIPIIGLNVSEFIVRKYYEANKSTLSEYIIQSLGVVYFIVLIIGVVILIIPGNIIYSTVGVPKYLLVMSVSVSFFTCINNIERGLLRCENNNRTFAVLVLGQTLLYFISIWVVYGLGCLTIYNAALIEVLSYFIYFLISLLLLWKKYNLSVSFNLNKTIEIIRYVSPLVINSVSMYMFALSDRFIISDKLGEDRVAIYNATFQVVSVLQIIAVSFNAAWHPWALKNLTNGISLKRFNKITLSCFLAFATCAFLFCILLTKYLDIILGSKYEDGKNLVILMGVVVLFQFGYWLRAPIIQFYKHNWLLTYASIPSFLISVILNLFFVEDFGLVFAVYVSILSWAFMCIFTFATSQMLFNKTS